MNWVANGLLRGTPTEARVLRSCRRSVLEPIWLLSDTLFVLKEAPVIQMDFQEIGAKKLRSMNAAIAAWPQLRIKSLMVGRSSDSLANHGHLMAMAYPDPATLCSAFDHTDGDWDPPGGWEDLILVRGEHVLAWYSSHRRLFVLPRQFAPPDADYIDRDLAKIEVSWRDIRLD